MTVSVIDFMKHYFDYKVTCMLEESRIIPEFRVLSYNTDFY